MPQWANYAQICHLGPELQPRVAKSLDLDPAVGHTIQLSHTLDSGIDVAPGINVAPPLKNFHITILTLFYINLGIAVIFDFIFSSIFFKN